MSSIDHVITGAINGWAGASPVVDFLFIAITHAFVPLIVASVISQWWMGQDRRFTRHVLVASGFSFLAGLAINQVILLIVHRIRPYDQMVTELLVAPSSDFSFPSDHTTAAFAVAAAFLLRRMPRRGLVYLGAALLVALSRIYVGVHFAGDVLGGALTGTLAAVVVAHCFRRDSRLDRILTGIF